MYYFPAGFKRKNCEFLKKIADWSSTGYYPSIFETPFAISPKNIRLSYPLSFQSFV